MKFLHTSDWHVGRTLNGWSLLEEQEWAFQQIVDLAIREQVSFFLIYFLFLQHRATIQDKQAPTAINQVTLLLIRYRLMVSNYQLLERQRDKPIRFFTDSNLRRSSIFLRLLVKPWY